MGIEKIDIDLFLQLADKHPVLDVRSPGEYDHAHLPGAINLPLFTNEERATVGTAYKQQSREQAIRLGLDFFGPRMRSMVETAESILPRENSSNVLLIYCWRGGMRSAAVAWLMDLYGFKVYTLSGGYKKFRQQVLQTFTFPFPLKILGGYTGSGKTEVLKELEKTGEKIIDLEEIARHKGSAFGNIGMPKQPSQEMFENILAEKLRRLAENKKFSLPDSLPTIWIEDESQRIGLVNIPNDFWFTMRKSPVYFLEIPFTERLKHIAEEYGSLDKQRMIDAINRIRERLGGLEAKNAVNFLENGQISECFSILLTYYDKWYLRGLHNREGLNSLLITLKCESITPLNAKYLIQQPEYHEKL